MADVFRSHPVPITGPGRRHFAIVPSDTLDMAQRPRAIYCTASGPAVLVDDLGVAISYYLTAGQTLNFGPVRVNATGTTATLIGWY